MKRNKIIIISLFLLWFFLTLGFIITFDTSFSIWSYNHNKSVFKDVTYDLIEKNQTIRGEFTAQDNNLGIVAVRFQTYIRPPYKYEDRLSFRLREKGTSNWYYQSTYRSGLVYDVPFFPFGFPLISDSKGKIYEFEITSLNANEVNKISIKNRFPIIQSKYKYSREQILFDQQKRWNFLWLKFSNAFKNPDVLFTSFVYLLPLIFYLIWVFFIERKLGKAKNQLIVRINRIYRKKVGDRIKLYHLLFTVVLADIFIFQTSNGILYLLVSVLWLTTLKAYHEVSKISFIVGIVLILICPVFISLGKEPIAENSAAWAFQFIVISLIHIIIDSRNERKSIKKSNY